MAFKTIKLVTDSVADLPQDLIDQWDITVVPAFVIYGGQSYADDGVELVREEFYANLDSMADHPTTAAMPPGMAHDGIAAAFSKGADHVIAVTTPAGLSGIHNSMHIAARDFPEDQVTVVDSTQLSIGMAWQVLLGAEVAAETGDVAQTLAAIEQVRQQQHTFALLTTLKYLRRSGRVSSVVAGLGALLDIKLVIQVVDGEVVPVARVRTHKRALDKLVELIRPNAPFERMAIMHAINPDGARALLEQLQDVAPPNVRIESICPAIGVHGGPGIVGAATVRKGWRNALSVGNSG